MRWIRGGVRALFAVVFALGAVVHLVQGRRDPAGYAAFGRTAWGPLARLWTDFVMPHIGALTLVMALLELALAVGLVLGDRWCRLAALAACGFFCFLLLLGYGWPAAGWWDDFLRNRMGSLVMLALMGSLLVAGRPAPLGERP